MKVTKIKASAKRKDVNILFQFLTFNVFILVISYNNNTGVLMFILIKCKSFGQKQNGLAIKY